MPSKLPHVQVAVIILLDVRVCQWWGLNYIGVGNLYMCPCLAGTHDVGNHPTPTVGRWGLP